MPETTLFFYVAGIVAFTMLIWDTIEVGRNDAANIVNAVFGARVLRRRSAVRLAGFAVILGAWASSPVIETARTGIFDPGSIKIYDALAIYLAVYITDTVLLYSFSAYGMPISTTAGLVFSLIGGAVAVGADVHWGPSGKVIMTIVSSIFVCGGVAFLIQRAFRGAIGQVCDDIEKVSLHGPWISGALMTGLVYFLLMKGMKNVAFVQAIRAGTFDVLGAPIVLITLWCILSFLTWLVMRAFGTVIHRNLFAGLSVIGMLAIAFAFGQNDLANCASPGISAYMILKYGEEQSQFAVPSILLLLAGCLLAVGMSTEKAQRVTRAEANTGSQGDVVRLYAPRWCIWIAKKIAPTPHPEAALAPEPPIEPNKKLQHYDALRAAVITSVSASVIAFASGMKMPVSTTYIAFAAVVSTGWADRIFQRGDSHIKVGRTIWVVTCWFLSGFLALAASAFFSKLISVLGVIGIVIGVGINLTVRYVMRNRSDRQEQRLLEEALERKRKLFGADFQQQKMATEHDSDEM